MDASRTGALSVLREAMRLETEGRQFYRRAAEAIQDETLRQTFADLAGDEETHLKVVQQQYQALSEGGPWQDTPGIPRSRSDWDRPLFPRGREAVRQALASTDTPQEALLFGLSIETLSFDLYHRAATEEEAAQAQAVFQFLSGEERHHWDLLMMRYEALTGPTGWTS
ncbi:MAG: ferritin family protein [Dehalococcoidia bacterium]